MDIYKTRIELEIEPVWSDDPPEISVHLDRWHWKGLLNEKQIFCHQFDSSQSRHKISVEFSNKKDTDTRDGLDKAVIIKSLKFNDISSDRFVWQGKYYPRYPEPWASQQKQDGRELAEFLPAHTYLGWNGIWILEFDVPIFTWIHQVEGLGWIYD